MPVYLITAGTSGFCKIGAAADPAQRMRDLQTAHYEPLALTKTWPGSYAEEGAMHRAFLEYHCRGEWHRFTPAMLDANPAEILQTIASLPPISVIPKKLKAFSRKESWRQADAVLEAVHPRVVDRLTPVATAWVRDFRAWVVENNLSVVEAAEMLGVKPATARYWLAFGSKPFLAVRVRLADADARFTKYVAWNGHLSGQTVGQAV